MNISGNLNAINKFANGVNQNAHNIANANTEGKDVKLTKEIPEMMNNEQGVEINATVIKAKDDMLGNLLDIVK